MQKLQAKRVAEEKEEAEKNKKEGDEFLAKNKTKKGVKTTASGLQYEVIKEGTRSEAEGDRQVKVNYTRHQDRRHEVRQLTADHAPSRRRSRSTA